MAMSCSVHLPFVGCPSLCSPSSRSRAVDAGRWHLAHKRMSHGRTLSSPFLVRCKNAAASASPAPCKIVTFVGKGGVGKTFTAVLAAQYYASLGLRTALAIHSQDRTADFLLNGKIGTYLKPFTDGNLSAFRVDATQLILEPWSQLKQVDAELNFTQGALQTEVAGEELSMLPGFDSILVIGLLEQLVGVTGYSLKNRGKIKERYDVLVYDGRSSEETFRIFGAAERIRWYLRRLRNLASKTDAGRVALPSILKAVGPLVLDQPADSSTAEIWEAADSLFTKAMATFADRRRFGCYLVTNSGNRLANECALRYWGCAAQAGVHVSGAVNVPAPEKMGSLAGSLSDCYSPLPTAEIPRYSFSESPAWKKLLGELHPQVHQILQDQTTSPVPPPVAFDKLGRTVTFFLPGFSKSEVKLSQWRGNAELLVEAGDQRRSVSLPREMQGRVVGAKFDRRSLIVTIGKP